MCDGVEGRGCVMVRGEGMCDGVEGRRCVMV